MVSRILANELGRLIILFTDTENRREDQIWWVNVSLDLTMLTMWSLRCLWVSRYFKIKVTKKKNRQLHMYVYYGQSRTI